MAAVRIRALGRDRGSLRGISRGSAICSVLRALPPRRGNPRGMDACSATSGDSLGDSLGDRSRDSKWRCRRPQLQRPKSQLMTVDELRLPDLGILPHRSTTPGRREP